MTVRTATLGGGCFWCLDAVYREVPGVTDVVSGYAGGHDPDPDYRKVCSGSTGHAEVVQVGFDPEVVSYERLLDLFFRIHDPTTKDRQGNDVGTQYRSIVLTHDDQQEVAAKAAVAAAQQRLAAPVVTEVRPFGRFFPAETEHQDYFRRNPDQAYCRAVVAPKVAKARLL